MSLRKLMVVTQYTENYGSVEEPHWKMKGGEDYLVSELSNQEAADLGHQGLSDMVTYWCKHHLINNPMAQEFELSWHLS